MTARSAHKGTLADKMPAKPTHKRTALIADDHGLYRAGLSFLLRDILAFAEVLEASSFDSALDQLAVNPNVTLALFDLSMPGMGGPESLAVVRETYPHVRVAIISGSEERDKVVRTISTGLSGYIPKSLSEDEIVKAINGILEDRIFVPRFMTAGALAQRAAAQPAPSAPAAAKAPAEVNLDDLTLRQRDVLSCISRGLSNKEIARELDVAEGTVKIHLAALFAHFGARNRTELATRAQSLTRQGQATRKGGPPA